MHAQGREFQIIRDYFQCQALTSPQVILGIGDDCALIAPRAGYLQAISVDTSVAGCHFPADASAFDIAYRALNVSLSDLAAMGADAQFFTLALTLPDVDEHWLQAFSEGLFRAAANARVVLAGGDTTRGPLSITVQVHGDLPAGTALLRSGAQVGDYLYVSGCLGDAAAGLKAYQQGDEQPELLRAYLRPEPQLVLGQQLRALASSCIDISDGLLADAGHILAASGVAASIDLESMPLSPALCSYLPYSQALALALTGGDDYQLCFTSHLAPEVLGIEGVYCIGRIQAGSGLQLLNPPAGFTLDKTGFDHFDERI